LIRHAFFRTVTFPVLPLTVAMISPAIRGLLILAIGLATLLLASFLAATITAIAVATVTTATNVENGCTANGDAKPLAEYHATVPPHPYPVTGWTSRPLS
jgi:hypothetical protein